jgi:CMP/dCMP kinase
MSDGPGGIVVTIDGPAASGKSSTARAVASLLGFRYLDSGAFSRALTLAALDREIPPEAWPALKAPDLVRLGVAARPADREFLLTIGGDPVMHRLRSPAVDAHVSKMAAIPAVRVWLLDSLRRAGSARDLVTDGRDMGTVVFPDADVKVFLVCDPRERAIRRLRQEGNPEPSSDAIGAEILRLLERDRLDQTRAIAPLLPAADAILLDTTGLEFDEQVRIIGGLARDARNARHAWESEA